MKFKLWEKVVLGVIFGVVAIAVFFICAVLFNLLSNSFAWNKYTFVTVFKTSSFWILVSVLEIALTAATGVLLWRVIGKHRELIKDSEGENSHLLTFSEMKKSKDFVITKFSEIGNIEDGVVVRAEKIKSKNDISVVLAKTPTHVEVIGTIGTGKTAGYLNPTIQILIHSKTKPSMILSDPKGELFDTHSQAMLEQGYNVEVIDLKEPYKSTKWNPFNILKTRIDKIKELSIIKANQNGKYVYEQKEFEKRQLQIICQELRDDMYESCRDLASAFCVIQASHDPKWQEGARDLINAIMLALCEDYELEVISQKEFCLANVYNIVINYAVGDCALLKEYLVDSRSKTSKVKGLASAVLSGEGTTLSSYLTNLKDYVIWLSDQSILSLTSENEVDFSTFDNIPSALFIKVPDEKETRHKLVSVLITQIYKELVNKATQNKNSKLTNDYELLRTCYFMLDEFGNLPVIPRLDTIITVSRSRKIFFTLIIQSYSQLENKYGKNTADIIKGNCPIKIFLGTSDERTLNEMVALSGKKKILSLSVNENSEKSGQVGATTGVREISLVTTTELQTLNSKDNFGNAYITYLGHMPFMSKFTPSFKVKEIYGIKDNDKASVRSAELFNEEEHYFDIEQFLEREAALKEIIEKELKQREREKEENFVSQEEYLSSQNAGVATLGKKIEEKVNKLKKLFTEQEFEELKKSNFDEIVNLLDCVIDKFNGNKSEMFELMELKINVSNLLDSLEALEKEEEEEQNVNQ